MRPVFVSIQTSAYSGATLLARLLAAHPQVATVGEMDGLIARENPDSYLCSCGCRMRECDFWQRVAATMQQRGFAFDVAHFELHMAEHIPRFAQVLWRELLPRRALRRRQADLIGWVLGSARLKDQVARNEAFIMAVLEVTGKRVFVDTSKDRLRLLALHCWSSLDVRAIHLVRDVRGVVGSRLRREEHVSAGDAARQWVRLHQRLQRVVATLPNGRAMRVRYEDVCRDVANMLAQLFHFCGVEPVAIDITQSQHIVGNTMRLAPLRDISLDERWRSLLTGEQLQVIERVAGDLQRQFGYMTPEAA